VRAFQRPAGGWRAARHPTASLDVSPKPGRVARPITITTTNPATMIKAATLLLLATKPMEVGFGHDDQDDPSHAHSGIAPPARPRDDDAAIADIEDLAAKSPPRAGRLNAMVRDRIAHFRSSRGALARVALGHSPVFRFGEGDDAGRCGR